MVVKDFEINHLLDKSIFKFSGGEKQKIACASVSAVSPEILVLDEPSSNLDSQSGWEFENIIRTWKQQQKTVIIAEHKLFFLSDVADRVIFIKDGEITNQWNIDDFRNINHRELGLRQLDLDNLVCKKKEYYSGSGEFLEFKNFKFNYGKTQVLDIYNVKIPKNEIIAIIGKNGAGKSTFANCLCGLKRSSKGELIFDGKALKRNDRLKKTYMVMQDVNHQLFSENAVHENRLP